MRSTFLFVLISIAFWNCQSIRDRKLMKENNKVLLITHNSLMRESETFLAQSANKLKDSVYAYIKRYQEYNFYNGREAPEILLPIIVNPEKNKALIPILQRTLDLSGNRVEYVSYISYKNDNGTWILKYNKGFSDSFGYETSNFPTLSDSAISIKIVRNFLLRHGIEPKKGLNTKIFSTPWYVL